MQLKRYTDYALRLLVYLGLHSERLVTIAEIAKAFGISKNHLMKVSKDLVAAGFVLSIPGKLGGLRLSRDPSTLSIGRIVRQMEHRFELVECLGTQSRCCIQPACRLKGMLELARDRFLEALDPYTLADVLENRGVLQRLMGDSGQTAERPPLALQRASSRRSPA